jgi:TPR repeat protein
MLAIIGGFLALLGSHKDVQTAAASSEVSRQARVRTEDASVPERQLASVDTSHGRVTDKATEAALNQLTRFELPSLRRQAEFGDDTAAFELGMSYEVGRGVPQNCAQAAQWVLQAAEGSKAAAEYNLGLRYRDGDGVPADPGAAAKWLRKASAHKYAGADIALSGLSTPGAIGGQP